MSSTVKIKIRFLMPCEKKTSFRPDPLLPKIVLSRVFLFPQARGAFSHAYPAYHMPIAEPGKPLIILAIVNIKTPTI